MKGRTRVKARYGPVARRRFLWKTQHLPAKLTYRERCAVHEAGHAVAMHLVHWPILEATIRPTKDEDGSVDHLISEWRYLFNPRGFLLDQALVWSLASHMEEFFCGEHSLDDDDYASLRRWVQICTFLRPGRVKEKTRRLWNYAAPLVYADTVREDVRRLAGALICYQTLAGNQVAQILHDKIWGA